MKWDGNNTPFSIDDFWKKDEQVDKIWKKKWQKPSSDQRTNQNNSFSLVIRHGCFNWSRFGMEADRISRTKRELFLFLSLFVENRVISYLHIPEVTHHLTFINWSFLILFRPTIKSNKMKMNQLCATRWESREGNCFFLFVTLLMSNLIALRSIN